MSTKANILLVGCGGVGSIAALNLERGGLASVTAVLRSNFHLVQRKGFDIISCDHGKAEGWRPTKVVNSIPFVAEENGKPFDYLICTTKNIPDIPPSLAEVIAPAVTKSHTVIVLIQNGLNIEKPFLEMFPQNIILSGVSLIGSNETSCGVIEHEYPDTLFVGAFHNPHLELDRQLSAAEDFVKIYAAGGKTNCLCRPDVGWIRWRKLVHNACLNSICAITDLDTGRIRLADGAVENLVRPAMEEIQAAARAAGHELPGDIVETMIKSDPLTMYCVPSMLADVRKGNYIEHENILGEALDEGTALGVSMPTIRVLYGLCKAVQWRTKERRGLVEIPPKDDFI